MTRKRRVKTVTSPEFGRILPRTASYAWLSPFRWSLLASLVILLGLSGALPVSSSGSPVQNKPEKPYALIFGTIWGPDDHPVYGVKVKIRRDRDKRASWELYSNHSGEFAQRVPAGKEDYVIWADLKGFKSASGAKLQAGDQVKIHVENDERVDTGIHLR
jgi:hypothetical protein